MTKTVSQICNLSDMAAISRQPSTRLQKLAIVNFGFKFPDGMMESNCMRTVNLVT